MNPIKKFIAKIFVPRGLRCNFGFKYVKKKDTYVLRPCIYWTEKKGWEYCNLLQKELSIQDQVKECGINERRVPKFRNHQKNKRLRKRKRNATFYFRRGK